jgi:hypothetical protein
MQQDRLQAVRAIPPRQSGRRALELLPCCHTVDENNPAPLPRDAFDDGELIKLIGLPLFTGCENAHHIWKRGRYFVQNLLGLPDPYSDRNASG